MKEINFKFPRRILAIALSLMIIVSSVPMVSFAQDDTIKNDSEITDKIEDPALEDDKSSDDVETKATLETAVSTVEGYDFNYLESTVATEEEAKTAIGSQINNIASLSEEITYEVVKELLELPTDSSMGSYAFHVVLSLNGLTANTKSINVEFKPSEQHINNILEESKLKVEAYEFEKLDNTILSSEDAIAAINLQMKSVNVSNDVNYKIISNGFTQASDTEIGSFTFHVELSYNETKVNTKTITVSMSLTEGYIKNILENAKADVQDHEFTALEKETADETAAKEAIKSQIDEVLKNHENVSYEIVSNEFVATSDEVKGSYTFHLKLKYGEIQMDTDSITVELEPTENFLTKEQLKTAMNLVESNEYEDLENNILTSGEANEQIKAQLVGLINNSNIAVTVTTVSFAAPKDGKPGEYTFLATLNNNGLELKSEDITVYINKLNFFDISINEPTNGLLNLNDTDEYELRLEENSKVVITVTPDEGYSVGEIQVNKVNDEKVALTRIDSEDVSYSYEFNLSKDTEVSVNFVEISKANFDEVKITEPIRINENNDYIFASGTEISLGVSEKVKNAEEIRVHFESTVISKKADELVQLNAGDKISKIELFYTAANECVPSWHVVDCQPLSVCFDTEKSAIQIKPDTLITDEYYNSDVSVGIDVNDDVDEKDLYSGIKEVYYEVINNEEVTQKGTLYTFDTENATKNQLKKTWDDTIVIDSELNNSDNAELYVKATDNAGNVTEETSSFKINYKAPEISINFDNNEASTIVDDKYYYQDSREATIEINDRATTFDKDAVKIEFIATDAQGNSVEAPVITQWDNADNLHTAKIKFEKDANYQWAISYVNKAGLANETVTVGENTVSAWAFTVDGTAPTGSVTIGNETESNNWTESVKEFFFGMLSKETFGVSATIEDVTSNTFDILYYKTKSDVMLSAKDLDTAYANGDFSNETPETSEDNEQYTIYVRLEDYAGNVKYIGSNGVIIDKTASKITITPDEANVNGYNNSDVNVTIDVNDDEDTDNVYSGIKEVYYEVRNNEVVTQSETLYTFEIENPTKEQLKKTWNDTIVIDSVLNNSENIELYVKVTDNVGNVTEETSSFKINSTEPKISVSFDNNIPNTIVDGKYYYQNSREATIVINDRATTFDKDAVEITLSATDAQGNKVEAPVITQWDNVDNLHIAKINFANESNYEWSISYVNKAGSANETVTVGENTVSAWAFTVDGTAPTGNITIGNETESNNWIQSVKEFFFGIWSNETFGVSAAIDDATSNTYDILYYKTDSNVKLTEEEIDNAYANGDFSNKTPETSEHNEQYAIYVRLEDYAGNVKYIGSNGVIIDKTQTKLQITTDEANANGYYNSDINVAINVNDDEDNDEVYSGIKEVYYEVRNNEVATQSEALYTFEIENPTKDQLEKTWNDTIVIDSVLNNSDNVELYVKVTDNAGNVTEETSSFKINSTVPEISVSFDNNETNTIVDDKYYYQNSREATIVINDRATTFDKDAVVIELSATDAQGNLVEAPVITQWKHEENLHTATINFANDANYEWSISYVNKADMENDQVTLGESTVSPWAFTVDGTAPTGSVTIGNETESNNWIESVKDFFFGIWSNETFGVSAAIDDATSNTHDILYYKIDSDLMLSADELVKAYANGDFSNETPETSEDNEQYTIYVRLEDYAGNVKYIGSNGVIIDKTASKITITPDEANTNSYYNSDVNVTIDVNDDEDNDEVYSGIKEVYYEVRNNEVVTQTETLYTFEIENPTKDQLEKTWNDTIVIDSVLNNSDNVELYVKVTDNAGNVTEETSSFKINSTAPKMFVSFDNNETRTIVDDKYYYQNPREATIVIDDRATTFDEDAVEITLSAIDAQGNPVEVPVITQWKHEDNLHTATIDFAKDANYDWSISYVNKADMENDPITLGKDTISPWVFTVDGTVPTGTIELSEPDFAKKFLEFITFGFYQAKATVKSTSDDETSPTYIEEYIVEDYLNELDDTQLDELYSDGKFVAYKDHEIDPNKDAVVYLRISDLAGNYIYIHSDVAIVDNAPAKITFTPDEANENNIYNSDFNVNVNVNDNLLVDNKDLTYGSGLSSVSYEIFIDGSSESVESGEIYSYSLEDVNEEGFTKEKDFTIEISEEYNGCDVVLVVNAVDNAGNSSSESISFDIDSVNPKIDISYDNDLAVNEKYFDKTRTATVVITERTHHFDSVKATEGIKITAKDFLGNDIEDAYEISDWKTVEGDTIDEATHTATIMFAKDANYEFDIQYTDNASNDCEEINVYESVAPFEFTVDTVKPSATVTAESKEGRVDEYDSLVKTLKFGFWSNSKINITSESSDLTAGIEKVEYYKAKAKIATDATTALKASELDKIETWKTYEDFSVTEDQQFTVYLKVTDMSGNYTYISTNGLIVDSKAPIIEALAPQVTIELEESGNGIYNDDVKANIVVKEKIVKGTYSGIKTVKYQVFDLSKSDEVPTQEGTLYNFDIKNPTQEQLVDEFKTSIKINSKLNNSNDVLIIVTAEDNSLNLSDKDETVSIDITKPRINISYDNNVSDSSIYFKENRTATIVVTERNFNEEDVELVLENAEGAAPQLSKWVKTKGTGNLDDTTWTAKINYNVDGVYKFDIAYTDKAGNESQKVSYADNTICATSFIVDKTAPKAEVTYNNNSAENSNYYKDTRTQTITITEHSFNASRVQITMTAADNGKKSAIPTVSKWTSNGDIHTATITYANDSLYTFDIKLADKAGNVFDDFEVDEFYVDLTSPELSIGGVEDRSANKGDVIPVIEYSDTNFDADEVNITLVGVNNGEVYYSGSYSDVANGQKFIYDNFADEKDVDDVYTLTATLKDKAGNSSTESILFSVNRFGSTYLLSKSTRNVIGKYIQKGVDLVAKEINTDILSNIKLTLFKNDETMLLEYGKDYTIDIIGGEGEWYEYTYTILKHVFADDGVYRLSIYSEDAAGNVSENTLDTKSKEINVGIDKTAPTISVSNILNDETYALDLLTVLMASEDNLRLAKVEVYLDDVIYETWEGKELAEFISEGSDFTFDVNGDSLDAHTVKIVSTDEAGNETVKEISNFYVTTNLWVRYYNNKVLFYGSIACFVAICAVAVYLIIRHKRKKEA